MIKLEDIKFEAKKVDCITEKYPIGKSGCEMVAWFVVPEDNMEVVYAEHDFTSETLTDQFKERALECMNKKLEEYENKFTTKIKRWFRRNIIIPKNRTIR